MKKSTIFWIAALGVSTLCCGLVYVTSQQVLRQSANDPQVEIAESASAALESGVAPAALIGTNTTDISSSLAVFVIVYDEEGKLVASSATLEGNDLTPPAGVFAYAKSHPDNKLTWQPKVGVRAATVIKHYGGTTPGFILVGKSLREVEIRTNQIMKIAFAVWILSIVFIFLCVLCFRIMGNRGRLR